MKIEDLCWNKRKGLFELIMIVIIRIIMIII